MSNKIKENKWKNKALVYSKQKRHLTKRLGEVSDSRQYWRSKYYALLKEQHLLKQKPCRHHYPVVLIWLSIQVYNCCHCSYRSCCEMVIAVSMILKIDCKKPGAATVRYWMIKYGYYSYHCGKQPDEGRWAVVVDESVSIGQEKLLLVLGIPVDNWQFSRTITHRDVRVLHISIATSWKADAIARILKELAQRLEISYCISDKGNNIMGALKQAACYHVYDCSHQWAKLMENLYSQSGDFTALMSSVAMLRRQWVLSRYAHLMPPAVRSKSRFQNIFVILKWVEKIWLCWQGLDEKAKECLDFLEQSRELIEELIIVKQVTTQMGKLLKVEGMSRSTLQRCEQILNICCKGRPLQFKNTLIQQWQCYEERLQENQRLLCSSDIIESYFGRFKHKIKSNGMQAITETVLTMSGWATTVTKQSIQQALTKVSIKDIKEWKKNNTTPSLIQKRNMFLNKNCTKTHPDF